MTVGQALRSPQFIVLSLTYFCCCAAHSGPIFHTVSYALACGLPAMTAVTIYSVEGLAGLGGRILFGLLGDRFGARRVVVVGLMVQAIGAGSYYFTRDAGEFYAVAILFGMAYGGVMPLYAVLAREYFPMRIMGTVFGGAAMISSLGMALGPAVGGWIFDTFHGYGYLYIASFGIGLAAVAIALAFPPLPSRQAQHASAAGINLRRLRNAGATLRVDRVTEPGDFDESGPVCPAGGRCLRRRLRPAPTLQFRLQHHAGGPVPPVAGGNGMTVGPNWKNQATLPMPGSQEISELPRYPITEEPIFAKPMTPPAKRPPPRAQQ